MNERWGQDLKIFQWLGKSVGKRHFEFSSNFEKLLSDKIQFCLTSLWDGFRSSLFCTSDAINGTGNNSKCFVHVLLNESYLWSKLDDFLSSIDHSRLLWCKWYVTT